MKTEQVSDWPGQKIENGQKKRKKIKPETLKHLRCIYSNIKHVWCDINITDFGFYHYFRIWLRSKKITNCPVFYTCRRNPFPRIAGPPRRRFIEIQYNISQVLVNSRKEALVWPGLPPRHRHLTWQKGGNHRLSFDMVYFLPVLMGWVLHSGEICVNSVLLCSNITKCWFILSAACFYKKIIFCV